MPVSLFLSELQAFCIQIFYNDLVVNALKYYHQLFKKAKARGYGDHDTAAIYRATD